MGNEQVYSQFDRYLSGGMTSGEKAEFLKALRTDPALQEELNWMQSAVGEIRGVGRGMMKARIASATMLVPASELEPYKPAIEPKSPGFFRRWWPAAGAAAVVAGLAAWYFWPGDPAAPQPAPVAQEPATEIVVTDPVVAGQGEQNLEPADKPAATPPPAANECKSFTVEAVNEPGKLIPLELCPQKESPTYSYGNNRLVLRASYSDATNLRIRFEGDTLYMSDAKPGHFVLVNGKQDEPLVRIPKKTTTPSIGIKPEKP